jgi:hypothetical protein
MRGKVFGWLAGLMPMAAQAEGLPSAVQVLDVFQLADQGPAALIEGFEALGFEVQTKDQTWPGGSEPAQGDYALVLDLWSGQQPYATALCLSAGRKAVAQIAAALGEDTNPFATAGRQPYPATTDRRVICAYLLWNPEPELTPFLDAATDWAEAQIGPLVPEYTPDLVRSAHAVNLDLTGSGRVWAIQLDLIAGGEEGSMAMRILTDYGHLLGLGPDQARPADRG